jgi:hypothetical protein
MTWRAEGSPVQRTAIRNDRNKDGSISIFYRRKRLAATSTLFVDSDPRFTIKHSRSRHRHGHFAETDADTLMPNGFVLTLALTKSMVASSKYSKQITVATRTLQSDPRQSKENRGGSIGASPAMREEKRRAFPRFSRFNSCQ